MKRLVIDLGHGGTDPGAIGPNKTHEADVVLAIGKELNELLKG
ncbi:MAG: N-acetylmuramoyl-L-alanine amidase family protein, partial [Paraclostridium sp.]